MKILITGATGLVGSKLVEELMLSGYDDIRILTTNKVKAKGRINFPVEICEWNPLQDQIEKGSLDNVDIIFHLAGESVAEGRWSEKRKSSIKNSRIKGTQLILDEIERSSTTPKKFISSSAVGIYGSNLSDETITADSPHGNDFLAEVCKVWESTLLNHKIEGMQAHTLRTGIVLSDDGGALKKMLLPFKLGAGGILGSGKQYMSWIHRDDLVNAFIFIMKNTSKNTAYNGVSPTPVTNKVFTKTLGRVLSRPTISPVPGFMLKLIFGEMSEILLKGQKVLPTNLIDEGFKFKYTNLEESLRDNLKYHISGEVLFQRYQWIDSPVDSVFNFFSDAKNLEKITPSYLNFKILGMNTEKIETGSLIDYQLQIHGIPLKWKTRINNFEDGKSFIDEQLKGPYTKWVHKHDFLPIRNGTLISDKVVYKIPMGALGKFFAGWYIRKDVSNIFNFRNSVINKTFI